MELRKPRKLKANEIECRVGSIAKGPNGPKGVSLLLYKDARCDMTILDETFGANNWKREHSRDNANCTVSVWDGAKNEWVPKEDVGSAGATEPDKALASDSFKRACVNWGIGRELYTAPFIWVPADKLDLYESNGKWNLRDKFDVKKISYSEEGDIAELVIENGKGLQVFSWRA